MLAVIQYDAVSVPVVERMLHEGRLPILAALRERGRLYPLTAPILYFGDRATAHTGTELPHHGQYFPLQWSASEQRLRSIYNLPQPEAVWERLGRAGRRSLVLDPYEGRRPRHEVGVAISGVQFTHSVVLQRWSHPHSVQAPLIRRLGRSREVEDAYGWLNPESLRRLRAQLLAAPLRTVEAVRHFTAKEHFDLVWVEFGAAHLAGHHFWPTTDDDERVRAVKDGVLEEVYAAVDAAAGRILELLPSDADVLAFSESGMAENSSRSDLLPAMLGRVLGDSEDEDTQPGTVLWRLRSTVPARWRLRVTQLLPDRAALRVWSALHLRGVRWDRTRAFTLPSDHDGYIRINLRGREQRGIVEPAQVEELIAEISAGLKSFHDADGVAWVESVDRVRELLPPGPALHDLPDLVVRWNQRPSRPHESASSPAFGTISRAGHGGIGRAGNHVHGGWVLAVPGRSKQREPTRPVRLVDVAATACGLLDGDCSSSALTGEPLLSPP